MPQNNAVDGMPTRAELISATFKAIQELGGSARNNEMLEKVIHDLELTDEVCERPSGRDDGMTLLKYNMTWARNHLKNYGAIENSARSVWSITPNYRKLPSIDGDAVERTYQEKERERQGEGQAQSEIATEMPVPDELQEWRGKLIEKLTKMDWGDFERLAVRLLRECGFDDVVRKGKSGDHGIDGTARMTIGDLFTLNVAFQCKRYDANYPVGAPLVRDFRGSLPKSIEKGVIITTSRFTRDAEKEARHEGKIQIDLIDGSKLADLLRDHGLGVIKNTSYEVDEDFFENFA